MRGVPKITLTSHIRKNVIILSLHCYIRNFVMDVIAFPENLQTTSLSLIILNGDISLPDATSGDKESSLIIPCSS